MPTPPVLLRPDVLIEPLFKVAFVEAVKTLDRLLADEATGQTLEPLYKRIPDPLRGEEVRAAIAERLQACERGAVC